jgi:hypothetical protein
MAYHTCGWQANARFDKISNRGWPLTGGDVSSIDISLSVGSQKDMVIYTNVDGRLGANETLTQPTTCDWCQRESGVRDVDVRVVAQGH